MAFGFDWLGRRSMIDAIPLAGGVPIFFCETWCFLVLVVVGMVFDVVGGSCDGTVLWTLVASASPNERRKDT